MALQAKSATAQQVPVPTTQAELGALIARREELSNQLRSLSDLHQQLVGERFNAQANQNPGVVAALDARLAELGARIRRIEQQKLAADDAIAEGIGRVAQTEGTTLLPPPNASISLPGVPPPFPPFELDASSSGDRERVALLGSTTLVILALIAWRWSAGRRKGAREQLVSGEAQATKDLRVAVETIAVEVERISENQRFITKLLSERKAGEPAMIERPHGERP